MPLWRNKPQEAGGGASPPGPQPSLYHDPGSEDPATARMLEEIYLREQDHLNAARARSGDASADGQPRDHRDPGDDTAVSVPGSGSAARDWSAIVVDVPIGEFEPRAPTFEALYRPDTEFDGWQTPDVILRSASVRGYLHRHNGKPRQDAVCAVYHKPTRSVVFSVADGVSSSPRSELGAHLASTEVVNAVVTQLEYGEKPNWPEAVDHTVDVMRRRGAKLVGEPNPDLSAIEQLLATTLVAGVVRTTHDRLLASIIQIGDSGVWLLGEGGYIPMLTAKHNAHDTLVSNAVSPLPRRPATPIRAEEFSLEPGSVLLVGTDGFGDPLGDGDGLVGRLFARHLFPDPPPAVGLAHLLDFSRELFDDDRTLLALWPRPPVRSAP